ncbi:DM13 domain-containing protein [Streptomyces sp. NBC_01294]|uniref:DM13 domain-containing protein n=1 Tax=Streptomyces sp. NBC_01294 TaxID=2903815 RepID=UPI002DDA2F3C|nr:DM13 domain-containing protein [Streptomyces sp. NBC_01294]WRZ55801.1 DM13 domain-containing protein [Streptomyces sp. NBC_01294]
MVRGSSGSRWRRRPLVIGALIVLAAGLALGLYWFEPWKLWVDRTVEEALPSTSAAPSVSGTATPAPGPVTVAQGTLISHEHTTTGTVRLLRLADGSHVLRLEDLDTSNGPDLRVWLTDAPVKEGREGWHVFDDGEHISLGALKGNKGDQNYAVPPEVNPADYTSLSIWCDRFDVSFGAARLDRP